MTISNHKLDTKSQIKTKLETNKEVYMTFIDEAMKSIDELGDTINKCDFKSVKLVAITTKFTRDALDNHEITLDTYNILMNKIGIMTSTAPGKCSCTKI